MWKCSEPLHFYLWIYLFQTAQKVRLCAYPGIMLLYKQRRSEPRKKYYLEISRRLHGLKFDIFMLSFSERVSKKCKKCITQVWGVLACRRAGVRACRACRACCACGRVEYLFLLIKPFFMTWATKLDISATLAIIFRKDWYPYRLETILFVTWIHGIVVREQLQNSGPRNAKTCKLVKTFEERDRCQ